MLYSPKTVKRELKHLSRNAGGFDASRYFRGDHHLGFYNVGTGPLRVLARSIYAAHRARWRLDDAMVFADTLIRDRYLEMKAVGIEVLARYCRDLSSRTVSTRVLARSKRWLAGNHSANWATTDAMSGALIGPRLARHGELASRMRAWSKDRNMWVRRASIVSLLPLVRRGHALDLTFEIAGRLHTDDEDLIQKAVGWTLREAGKVDRPRLERHLRTNGRSIPRTTIRYAIERFPARKRRALLAATKR
jgi:3-methyladenine DNA glycosylase AlkD